VQHGVSSGAMEDGTGDDADTDGGRGACSNGFLNYQWHFDLGSVRLVFDCDAVHSRPIPIEGQSVEWVSL
jgi:hypothetical protein